MSYCIYVGTYAKYNSGNLSGGWLYLEDYACNQDFYEACEELHSDEADPEFMFQDHEGIPDFFIGESYLNVEIWDYLDSPVDDAVKMAYVEAKDKWDEEDCESSYIGKFDNFTDLARYLVDDERLFGEIPESFQYYINYEAFGRDLRIGGDVVKEGYHFFWDH